MVTGCNLNVLDPGGDISGNISHLCMSGSGRSHLSMLGTVQSGVPEAPWGCRGVSILTLTVCCILASSASPTVCSMLIFPAQTTVSFLLLFGSTCGKSDSDWVWS